jgi:hypothetical protein
LVAKVTVEHRGDDRLLQRVRPQGHAFSGHHFVELSAGTEHVVVCGFRGIAFGPRGGGADPVKARVVPDPHPRSLGISGWGRGLGVGGRVIGGEHGGVGEGVETTTGEGS